MQVGCAGRKRWKADEDVDVDVGVDQFFVVGGVVALLAVGLLLLFTWEIIIIRSVVVSDADVS
jgi:hypothetical protein